MPTTSDPLRVAPSILSADFARLADEIAEIAPVVPMVHVDVMDGHYVPNLTIGPPVVKWIRKATDLFIDAHLMIEDPDTYAPQFVAAGADSVTFHPETSADAAALVSRLHEDGAEVGMAVKPRQGLDLVVDHLATIDMLLIMTVEPGFGGQAFMPEMVDKIAAAREWRDDNNASFRIEVDGGITPDTVGATVAAGADTFVAGSAVFNQPDRQRAVKEILAAADAA
ncbi:MAG: ribulose-phosphate 3-epimerase [Nitriliruptorales bacterium]|nr:ribulose-phosphate 3-epimerase [Nitriliruptorales bacterium]